MNGRAITLLLVIAMVSLLTGCAGKKDQAPAADSSKGPVVYRDGVYTARSGPDERGAVGEITLVIEQGKIAKADYKGIMKGGHIKDEDYGKTNGRIENKNFYRKAQQALKGTAAYPGKLLETQNPAAVDAVSGATVSHRQFKEAVERALQQAASPSR